MLMKKSLFAFAAVIGFASLASGLPGPASAATLLGETVTGSLNFSGGATNFFDPVNGSVPFGFLNAAGLPVIISDPELEFGFVTSSNTDVVDLFANGFTVTDNVKISGSNDSFTILLTSNAFIGLILQELSDSFTNGGIIGSLLGDTITLSWAGGSVTTGLLQADFSLTPSAVPIPAALPLLLGGLAGLGLIGRKSRRKAAA